MSNGKQVALVLRITPQNRWHARQIIGFVDDDASTFSDILRNWEFGMSLASFFKLVQLSPRKIMDLCPHCANTAMRIDNPDSPEEWSLIPWDHLGLDIPKKEIQALVNLLGFSIVEYVSSREDRKDITLLERTDPIA